MTTQTITVAGVKFTPATPYRPDVALSLHFAEIAAYMIEPRQCWRNAFLLATLHPTLSYVEGHVVTTHGIVTEHGWNLTDDGRHVDATYAAFTGWEKPDHDVVELYFPARTWTVETMPKISTRISFPLMHWREPEYDAAYLSASFHAYGVEGFEVLMRARENNRRAAKGERK